MAYVRKEWDSSMSPSAGDFNRIETGINDVHNHIGNQNNPHGVTPGQISAVPTVRNVGTGTGLTGGGSLSVNRSLSLDLSYTDGRYLGKSAKANDADKLDGYHASSFAKLSGASFTGPVAALSSSGKALELNAADGGYKTNTMSFVKNGTANNYEWNMEFDTGATNRDFWMKASGGGSMRFNVDGDVRVKGKSVHTGNVGYGTANPSGGSNGDIYIQY